jgi:hypothetical protein
VLVVLPNPVSLSTAGAVQHGFIAPAYLASLFGGVIAANPTRCLTHPACYPRPQRSGPGVLVRSGVQYMVSWNVKHLANVNKREHLARICARCGYIAPEILTPDVFWEIES